MTIFIMILVILIVVGVCICLHNRIGIFKGSYWKQIVKGENILISVLLIIILILVGWICLIYSNQPTSVVVYKQCVPNEETAISIAQAVCKSYTGIEVEKKAFVATDAHTYWQVNLKKQQDFGENVIANDDSGIFINKKDGTIMAVWLDESDVNNYLQLREIYSD